MWPVTRNECLSKEVEIVGYKTLHLITLIKQEKDRNKNERLQNECGFKTGMNNCEKEVQHGNLMILRRNTSCRISFLTKCWL